MKRTTEFQILVYQATRKIPSGKVSTYGDIAQAIGNPRAVRAVGGALNRNPFAPRVPCHRVVSSDGSIGGFAQGQAAKGKLLAKEGVLVRNGKIVDFVQKRYLFD